MFDTISCKRAAQTDKQVEQQRIGEQTMNPIIEKLLTSEEPVIRYKTRVYLLDEDSTTPEIRHLQLEIKRCNRVRRMLSAGDASGKIPHHPYAKWYGAHWVLVMLADMDYPARDHELVPLRDQVYEWLISEERMRSIKKYTNAGRTRMCASMEGNAIFAMLKLGLADERIDILVNRLLAWQWPDGGWNCDKKPAAHISSFTETLIPLRGLALYSQLTGHTQAQTASSRAAEVFLNRHLFKRQSDGTMISDDFLRLRYPCYWHYDILFGLKVMAEAGFLKDPRCREALDLLVSKRLPDGSFPAEKKHYNVTAKMGNGYSFVDWGGTSMKRMNPFVTTDALYVLKQAFPSLSPEVTVNFRLR
jgi:hypothetical protein